jgi:hypothetical protein
MYIGIRSGTRNGQPLRGVHAAIIFSVECLATLILANVEFIVVNSEAAAYAFIDAVPTENPLLVDLSSSVEPEPPSTVEEPPIVEAYASPRQRALRRQAALARKSTDEQSQRDLDLLVGQPYSDTKLTTAQVILRRAQEQRSSRSVVPLSTPPKPAYKKPPTLPKPKPALLEKVIQRERANIQARTQHRVQTLTSQSSASIAPCTADPSVCAAVSGCGCGGHRCRDCRNFHKRWFGRVYNG